MYYHPYTAFQSVFFAVIYDLWIIHRNYFISGFGAGNKMIDLLRSVILSQCSVFYYGNAFKHDFISALD